MLVTLFIFVGCDDSSKVPERPAKAEDVETVLCLLNAAMTVYDDGENPNVSLDVKTNTVIFNNVEVEQKGKKVV